MPPDEARLDTSASTKRSTKSPPGIDLTVSVNGEAIKALIEAIRRVVRETVREELVAHLPNPSLAPVTETPPNPPTPTRRGLDLAPDEPLKAKDLRTALLLGKVPENAGLLVDTETMAALLGISDRTLHRLVAEKAIPEPVRIGGRLIRWRLAETLEWIEAGCPHTKHWTYSTAQRSPTKGRR